MSAYYEAASVQDAIRLRLEHPDADIIGFDNAGMHYLQYEETESYRITEAFINRREIIVNSLVE